MLQHNFKNYTQIITKRKIDTFFSSYTKKNLIPTITSLKEKAMNLSIDKASDKLNLKIKKLTKKLKQ